MQAFLWLTLQLSLLLAISGAVFYWLGRQGMQAAAAPSPDQGLAVQDTSSCDAEELRQASEQRDAAHREIEALRRKVAEHERELAEAEQRQTALQRELMHQRDVLKEAIAEKADSNAASSPGSGVPEIPAPEALVEMEAQLREKEQRLHDLTIERDSAASASGTGALQVLDQRLASLAADVERLRRHRAVLLRSLERGGGAEDDLTQIKGIKTVIGGQLRRHGIRSYRQIACWDDEELAAFAEMLSFKNRATKDRWQEQARKLHEAKYGTSP